MKDMLQPVPDMTDASGKPQISQRIRKALLRDRYLLLLCIPMIVYFIVFHYLPMGGLAIAFTDYIPRKGILASPWAGLKHFRSFYESIYFWRLIKNTFTIGVYNLLWGFPIPIIFALMLEEIRSFKFRRIIQTISYMPHFISTVVVVGIMVNFVSPNFGIINTLIKALGYEPINFMSDPQWFRTLYISSNIWQLFGWQSIIYIAALSSIEKELYDAAEIDGAGRWKQMTHVTLPGLMPTIVIMFILAVGHVMNVGFEKIILMYSPANYEVSDVISTYVYRKGIIDSDYSFGTAAGMFNSVINFIMLLCVNKLSNKIADIGLW